MRKEKRRSRRRQLRYSAWLALEAGSLQGCVVSDISDTGARIDVENSESVPDQFMLWLANNGSPRRACSVVWRQPKQIGVKFHARLLGAEKASLVPCTTPEAGDADSVASETEVA